jgi:3-hydroxyacyl-CoA dehydrogenase
MAREIKSVAVLGAGTMGSGIAALCAEIGCPVLLLDVTQEAAERAIGRMGEGRSPMLEDAAAASRITPGALESDLSRAAASEWICEAIIEDLEAKRALLERVEAIRRDGSVISTNTSGIPLRAITEGMPGRLRQDIAVTHFFNPVKVMRLVELVAGRETRPEVVQSLARFLDQRLGKGVVHAKDTVNFIANRIGCFWMLAGLHKADGALAQGLSMEAIDALVAKPVGIPPTGLFGLIDLIGLDVMDLVAKNLAVNLPAGDAGRAYASLPPVEQAMLRRNQLGGKSGGGFYRSLTPKDGGRRKEVFDLAGERWREVSEVTLAPEHATAASLLFAADAPARFAWDLMSETLCYAADLVPEIADDIVNVDRALRWGFNWRQGPFQLLDAIGPERVIARLQAAGRPLPRMLAVLQEAGAGRFYRNHAYLGTDGAFHPLPD